MISELVLVCVVREARIKGEGTPASRGTGCLEKGTSGGKEFVLLLQLCGVSRALAWGICKLIQRGEEQTSIGILSVQIVTDWATSSTCMLEMRVGLDKTRIKRPRRMEGEAFSWDVGR